MSVTMLLSRHLQHLPSPLQSRLFSISSAQLAKRWREKNTASFQSELRNPVAEVEPPQVGVAAENGTPYDNKPFKLRVEKYHEYVWCGCGWARTSQPLCDGACECWMNRKIVKGGPVRYIAPKTQDIWLCNCKQTKNRPFCDGSHRSAEVQEHRFDAAKQLWEPRGKPVL